MFLPLARKRRSIRKFTNDGIPEDKIEALKEAALRAPSSRGHNPWDFVFVTDPALLEKLSKAKKTGSAFLAGAKLAVVVAADPGKSDVWIEDASIAATMIHLAAESLDLGSCWVQIRRRMQDDERTSEEYVAAVLRVPPSLKILAMVAIGVPAEQKPPHPRESLQDEKVFLNRYGARFAP